jgi:hypothetical protein
VIDAGRPQMHWSDPIPDQEFAEPVALSSAEPADLPLARTAARLRFDLLTPRARRKQQPTEAAGHTQEGTGRKRAQIARCSSAAAGLDITPILVHAGPTLDFPATTCLNRLGGRMQTCIRN